MSEPTRSQVRALARVDQETVIVAEAGGVQVTTTNPAHWRALKRRASRLGGTIEHIDMIDRKEVGGWVRFPTTAFSLARFGLRASPARARTVDTTKDTPGSR